MVSATPSFSGFDPKALSLLAALARNNDRTWFAPRKERFQRELLAPMEALVVDATAALAKAKIPIGGDRKRSMFRIYRDVRFSNDKRPYKTHLSAYLSYDGGRQTPGGIYVHVEPKRSFIGVAFYRIEKPMLQRWRVAMATRPAAFKRVVTALAKRGLTIDGPDVDEDSLARMPRGFEACASSELAPYFRLKSFCVHRDLAEGDVTSSSLVREIVRLARDARPLLTYGWALD
jgi:uncharacterized protein (TIGR02453 family)